MCALFICQYRSSGLSKPLCRFPYVFMYIYILVLYFIIYLFYVVRIKALHGQVLAVLICPCPTVNPRSCPCPRTRKTPKLYKREWHTKSKLVRREMSASVNKAYMYVYMYILYILERIVLSLNHFRVFMKTAPVLFFNFW